MRSGTRQIPVDQRRRRAALIAGVGLALIAVLVFFGHNPFASQYVIRGVFASTNGLVPGSDVRVAGVPVGQVTAIAPGPHDTSIVTMTVNSAGRPVHTDATLAIEPRLILEGNFYVNVSPGTPGAPTLQSGALIPLSHTSVPVQLDQVLDVFDLPTRNSLQSSIAALASGLGAGASPNGTSVPGYAGLRSAMRQLAGALPSVTQTAEQMRGTQAGDLSRAINSSGSFTGQLARDPQALADLVTSFDHVMGALAANDEALSASISDLDGVLREAPPSFSALNAALPATIRFANALQPALRVAPAPLDQTSRLLAQLQALVAPQQLPELLANLRPVTSTLPTLENRLESLLPLVTSATECISTHVVWTLDQKLQDGNTTTGDPIWQDALHAFAGYVGESASFDGNGVSIKAGIAQGGDSLSGVLPGLGSVTGFGTPLEGVRPTWLGYGVEPPYRPDERCSQQALPNLSARSGSAPTWLNSMLKRP